MISLSAATSNVLDKVLRGGVADLRPIPRTLVDHGPNRWVYRMAGARDGDPVLLVPPLAAPALCFDLRRGCSLAEHFVSQGRATYLVDYGTVSFPTVAWGSSTGSTRCCRGRSRPRARTRAVVRCTSWRGALAGSSPCSPQLTRQIC